MIQLNNQIDKGISVKFFHDGKEIGVCTNALTFLDALCQIKGECSGKYSIATTATLPNGDMRTVSFRISPDGHLAPVANKDVVLWSDIICKQLLYLEGLTPNFFYSKQTTF